MGDPREQVFESDKAVIRVRRGWCKNCEVCIEFCPTDALFMENGRLEVKADACILCGKCEQRCPDFAILVERKPSADDASQKKSKSEPKGEGR